MNWYGNYLERDTDESPLEHEYRSLCRQARMLQMRYDIAKAQHSHLNADALYKTILAPIYWGLQEVKSKRDTVAKQLRELKYNSNSSKFKPSLV